MGKAFDSIVRGLNEAIAHAKGKKVAVKTYQPEAVDVSALRQRMTALENIREWQQLAHSCHSPASALEVQNKAWSQTGKARL